VEVEREGGREGGRGEEMGIRQVLRDFALSSFRQRTRRQRKEGGREGGEREIGYTYMFCYMSAFVYTNTLYIN